MHVGRAAAEVRFDPEQIGLVVVLGPITFRVRAQNLVRLLVVLVDFPVRADRRGQRVVSDFLQQVAELAVAGNPDEMLQGVHVLHDGAQFGPLTWVRSGQPFVAGENAVHLAVVSHDGFDALIRRRQMALVPGQNVAQRAA